MHNERTMDPERLKLPCFEKPIISAQETFTFYAKSLILNSTKFFCDVFNSKILTYGTDTNPLPFFDFMFLVFIADLVC